MGKIGRLWIFCLLSVLGLHQAQAGTLTGELDKSEGSLEDQFMYTLTIQGSFDGEPELPGIPGLEIQKAGTSQNVSIINGSFSREVQVQFLITPQKEGTFVIPALKLKVDKKFLETLPLELKVSAGPSGQSSSGGASPESSDRGVFIEREFDRNKVYVGESIIARLKLFNRIKLYGASPQITYPQTFQKQAMGDQLSYQRTIGGEDYSVTELRSLLTPTKAGSFPIDPAVVEVQIAESKRPSRSMIDDWMGSRRLQNKRFRSAPATIEVLPLPLAGRRSDFSGLVGEFALEAEVSQRSLKLGDPTTVSLHIRGRGATTGMADPALDLGSPAKVYRDKPQSQDAVDAERGLLGDRIYKFAVVPTKAGDLDLGSIRIQFFHPGSGTYQDLTAELGKVHVEALGGVNPGDGSPQVRASEPKAVAQATPAKPVEQIAEDLVEPHGLARLLSSSKDMGPVDIYGSFALMILGVLSPFGSMLGQRFRSTAEERARRKRQSQAYKIFRKQTVEASRLLRDAQAKEAMHLTRQSLNSFLSNRLSLRARSLTAKDLESSLQQKGLQRDVIQKMQALWSQLDQLLYAAEEPKLEDSQALLKSLDAVVKELDRLC